LLPFCIANGPQLIGSVCYTTGESKMFQNRASIKNFLKGKNGVTSLILTRKAWPFNCGRTSRTGPRRFPEGQRNRVLFAGQKEVIEIGRKTLYNIDAKKVIFLPVFSGIYLKLR
jgi:hypothetical protein